ncbi:MAG: LacI family DNA-binding transcriptional regulator [Bryobacteraceae bacterium]
MSGRLPSDMSDQGIATGFTGPRRTRTRMKDIAEALGLSVITVSKALRNHVDISKATREKIRQKAAELNYRPNLAARSLVTQRSYVVGLVVPDLLISFFAEISTSLSQHLRTAGYELFLSNSQEDAAIEEMEIERLLGRQVDALIVATSVPPGSPESLLAVTASGIPLILIDRSVNGVQADFVGNDHREIGELATAHLLKIGCRNVAHIRGPDTSAGSGRLEGYTAVLARAGKKRQYVEFGGVNDEEGYAAMQRLLERRPHPDGVFCFNDLVAAGALRACLEAGFQVPRDIAIAGCGNHLLSSLLMVPLTTIDQQTALIGRRTAEVLLELLNGEEPKRPRQIRVKPKLIVRESTGRVRSVGRA